MAPREGSLGQEIEDRKMGRRTFLAAAGLSAAAGFFAEPLVDTRGKKEPEREAEKIPEKKETRGKAKVVDLSGETQEIPHVLRGNPVSLDRQNEMARKSHWRFYTDEAEMLSALRTEKNPTGALVQIPRGKYMEVDPYLQQAGDFQHKGTSHRGRKKVEALKRGHKYRRDYCRAATAEFLQDLASDYAKEFPDGPALTVSSGVRPKDVLADLKRLGNLNASPRSVHPTGGAVDVLFGNLKKRNIDGTAIWKRDRGGQIQKDEHGGNVPELIHDKLPEPQKRWIEGRLIVLKKLNVIETEQEGREPCYHCVVPDNYYKLVERNSKDLYE